MTKDERLTRAALRIDLVEALEVLAAWTETAAQVAKALDAAWRDQETREGLRLLAVQLRRDRAVQAQLRAARYAAYDAGLAVCGAG